MRTVGWNLTSLLASGSIDDIDGVIVRRKKAIAGGIVGDVIPATITANRVLGELPGPASGADSASKTPVKINDAETTNARVFANRNILNSHFPSAWLR